MKKKLLHVICTVVAMLMMCTVCLAGCSGGGGDDNTDTTPTEYTIQYTDDSGVHTITVTDGMPYSLDVVPTRTGYDFLGLYDAEVGGTQYVSASGSSLAPFTDKKNMVLFSQFKAKEYTLVLDYQGAAVTGSRSIKVSYNSEISDLPLNLTLENKNFVGWYTQPDKGGIQVADLYGAIPSKNIVDESIFDLSDPKGYIYLYAGFNGEEFAVTFYFTESSAPEEVMVEYGTPISEVQLETRVDGNAVIAWSKKRNDTAKEEIFNGKVTSEMVLYAAEYAPVIDFDSNGGNSINSIIARAGDAISLPAPTRENYQFIGWQTASGSTFSATTMPTASVKLTAKWQAMIVFDTNGGTDVTNISEPQGTKIELPETEKAGYMFAGWYDGNGEEYTATAMPSTSVKLYAKYWKIVQNTVVVLDASNSYTVSRDYTTPSMERCCKTIDVSDLIKLGVQKINVKVNYQARSDVGSLSTHSYTRTSWYSTKQASAAYLLWEFENDHDDTSWHTYSQSTSLEISGDIIYICFWGSIAWNGSIYHHGYWKDFYVEIEYPDMSTLY